MRLTLGIRIILGAYLIPVASPILQATTDSRIGAFQEADYFTALRVCEIIEF